MTTNLNFESNLAIKVRKQISQALNDFNLIQDQEKIMICVSGGKDSTILTLLLNEIRKKSQRKFTIEAVMLDQKQPGFDDKAFREFYKSQGIILHVLERDTYSIVKEKVKDQVYCSLCSRLRRAILYDFARDNHFQSMALGHHRDDVIETTLLNLFYSGKLSSMPAKLRSNAGNNLVIRPMVYVAEKDLISLQQEWNFPIIPCNLCGSQEGLKRKKIKNLVKNLENDIPMIGTSFIKALTNVNTRHLLDQNLFDFQNLRILSERSLDSSSVETSPEDELLF